MRLSDFDYNLPKELIAQHPAPTRDGSRMMVLDRKRKRISHKRFGDILSYLNEDDMVVFNDSKVIPARIMCRRQTGGRAEIFLLKKAGQNLYEALVRPASKLLAGKRFVWDDGNVIAEVVENKKIGRLIKFADSVNIEKDLEKIGRIPLPPYIKRDPMPEDAVRYQTVYAKSDGSTASPTAGLHFTEELLERMKQKKVGFSYVTLHVSYGTFAPVKTDIVEYHKMHKESFELPAETASAVRSAKAAKKNVIAVGTSTTRVLEDNAERILNGRIKGSQVKGTTGLFIYPGFKFRVVDMLITNFHLPKSTLLLLASAFAERGFLLEAYREAVRERYRFYSYGDCMLIL